MFTSATYIDFKIGFDIVHINKHALSKHYIKYLRVGTKIQVESLDSYCHRQSVVGGNIKNFTLDGWETKVRACVDNIQVAIGDRA